MSNFKLTMVIDAETGKAKTAVGGVIKDLGQLDGAAGKAAHGTKTFGSAVEDAGKKTGFFSTTVGKLHTYLGGLAFASIISQTISMADEWRSLSAQLKVSTKDHSQVAAMQEEVYRISQLTGAELASTGATYAKINRVMESLGGGMQQTSVITQALNDALKINKSTTAESAAAQLQFGQALESGVIRGDEFNSLMENATPLMTALAKELGVSTGELRGMAEEGMLTADTVLPAIMQASAGLAQTSEQMGLSVGASWTKIVNATQRWLGKTDEAWGATAALSGAFSYLADNIETVAGALGGVAKIGFALLIRNLVLSKAKFLGAAAASATFATSMIAGNKAGMLLGKTLLGVGKALKLAFPLYIVYEFFKALWDNSETAREAMRTLVTYFKNGWERIKFGAKAAGLGIKAAFKGAFNKVREFYADMISTIAKGFDLIGGDTMAAKLNGLADAIRPGVSAADELKAAVTDAYDDMTLSIELNNAELAEALEADRAEFKAKKGLGEQTKLTKEELNKLAGQLNTTTKKTKAQEKADKAAKKSTNEHATALQNLRDELDPLEKKSRDYFDALEDLDYAAQNLGLTEAELLELQGALHLKFAEAGDSAKDSGVKMEQAADPVAKAWEDAGKRIDESFSNAFKNGFRDMKSFGKNLVGSLKDTLAQMMYQLAKSKFFETIQGMGKSGGIMGGLSSLIPSSAGASGGGVPSIPGGGLLDKTVGVSSVGGVLAGGAGGYALGSAIDVGHSDIGGALGGAIGQAVIPIPVLGAAIGSALGSVVGSLFGQKYKTKSSGVELGYSGGELDGAAYQDQKKKRLIGSNRYRTLYDDLDSELSEYVSSAIGNIETGLIELTDRMGGDARAVLDEFTIERTKLKLSGLSEEEVTAKINDWIADTGAQLMAAVIPEFGGIIRAAGDQAGELLAPLTALGNYISADFAPSMVQTLQQADDATLAGLMTSVVAIQARGVTEDEIVGLTQDLAVKADARYRFEVDLLNQIASVRAELEGSIGGFKDMLFKDTASQQELADHYLNARNEAALALETATDPNEIKRLTQEALGAAWQGWALANDEEKAVLKDSMMMFATDLDASSKARLNAAKEETLNTHEETAKIVHEAMAKSSANLDRAAQKLENAAANIDQASINSDTRNNNFYNSMFEGEG